MSVSMAIAICLIGIIIVLFGLSYKFVTRDNSKNDKNKFDIRNAKGSDLVELLNSNKTVQNIGSKFGTNKALDRLFRTSKNPWHLTPFTFNAIRYGGLVVCLVLGVVGYFIFGISFLAIFAIFGFLCYFLPNKKYQDAAKEREMQWNQLYQFMWVIKHNASFYDPKKVWNETAKYIRTHTENLPELEQGFADFASSWNGTYVPEEIIKNYGDFSIPKELYEIMLVSQQTGEYPENELNSLREIIINKMDFTVNNIISTVGAKATSVSAPFLLASMFTAVLFPVALTIMEAFSG